MFIQKLQDGGVHIGHVDNDVDVRIRLDVNGNVVDKHFKIIEKTAVAPTKAPKRSAKEVISGAVGLAKAELGIDKADDILIRKRKEICVLCPDGLYDFGQCTGMGGCNCYLAAKVKIAGQKCPKGHW